MCDHNLCVQIANVVFPWNMRIILSTSLVVWGRSSTVLKVLCYKSEGRWFDGGWDMVNVWAKSRALFLYRLQAQGQRNGSLTAGWLKKWNLHSRTENPPFQDRIPASLDHWGDLGVDGWIILGWISRRWDVGIWTGLGWPRIETGGGRL